MHCVVKDQLQMLVLNNIYTNLLHADFTTPPPLNTIILSTQEV